MCWNPLPVACCPTFKRSTRARRGGGSLRSGRKSNRNSRNRKRTARTRPGKKIPRTPVWCAGAGLYLRITIEYSTRKGRLYMDYSEILATAKQELMALGSHLIDILDIKRPPSLAYAKNLAKVIHHYSIQHSNSFFPIQRKQLPL